MSNIKIYAENLIPGKVYRIKTLGSRPPLYSSADPEIASKERYQNPRHCLEEFLFLRIENIKLFYDGFTYIVLKIFYESQVRYMFISSSEQLDFELISK